MKRIGTIILALGFAIGAYAGTHGAAAAAPVHAGGARIAAPHGAPGGAYRFSPRPGGIGPAYRPGLSPRIAGTRYPGYRYPGNYYRGYHYPGYRYPGYRYPGYWYRQGHWYRGGYWYGGNYWWGWPAYSWWWWGSPSYYPDDWGWSYSAPAVTLGGYCATPQKTCKLIHAAPVGIGCSCRAPSGRGRYRGTVVP